MSRKPRESTTGTDKKAATHKTDRIEHRHATPNEPARSTHPKITPPDDGDLHRGPEYADENSPRSAAGDVEEETLSSDAPYNRTYGTDRHESREPR
jgi:hypothetical protein